MFKNLRAEIARKGINNFSDFASIIDMNSRTFAAKLSGISEFKLDEMKTIQEAIGNGCTLDYLFENNSND